MSHNLKRNFTRLIYVRKEKNSKLKIFISSLFQKKKSWNLKCIFKNAFSIVLCTKKNNIFWFQGENVFWDLKSAISRSTCPEVFIKVVLLDISQNSQENTCARIYFLKKLPFFTEHLNLNKLLGKLLCLSLSRFIRKTFFGFFWNPRKYFSKKLLMDALVNFQNTMGITCLQNLVEFSIFEFVNWH